MLSTGSSKFCGKGGGCGRVVTEKAGPAPGNLWLRPSELCFRGSRGGHVIGLCSPARRWMVGVKMAAAAAASIRERQTGTYVIPFPFLRFWDHRRDILFLCLSPSPGDRACSSVEFTSVRRASKAPPLLSLRVEMPLAREPGLSLVQEKGLRSGPVATVLHLFLSYRASKGHYRIWTAGIFLPGITTCEVPDLSLRAVQFSTSFNVERVWFSDTSTTIATQWEN